VLWYKFWLEGRNRFAVLLVGLVLFAILFLFYGNDQIGRQTGRDFRQLLFFEQQYVVALWMLGVVLIGMGGLLREQVNGSVAYTLALPVSRMRIVAVRFGIGLLESIMLGTAPWLAIAAVSRLTGHSFPIGQAGTYVLLLIGGGIFYFGLSMFVSCLVEGEYTAPLVAYGLIVSLLGLFRGLMWLRPFDPWRFMSGIDFINQDTWIISVPFPFPWLALLASASCALLMLIIAVRVTQRRDF
jgi:hypothetical protein